MKTWTVTYFGGIGGQKGPQNVGHDLNPPESTSDMPVK